MIQAFFGLTGLRCSINVRLCSGRVSSRSWTVVWTVEACARFWFFEMIITYVHVCDLAWRSGWRLMAIGFYFQLKRTNHRDGAVQQCVVTSPMFAALSSVLKVTVKMGYFFFFYALTADRWLSKLTHDGNFNNSEFDCAHGVRVKNPWNMKWFSRVECDLKLFYFKCKFGFQFL